MISKMAAENERRWEEMITSTDLTDNSRKVWLTIRNISNDPIAPEAHCLVTANQVAHQLLINGRGEMSTKPKCPKLSPVSEEDSSLVLPVPGEEYKKGIATLKIEMEISIDDVLVDQLNNLLPRAHRLLNAKCMLHREHNPQSMEAIKNHCNTGTGKRISDTEELQFYIPPMSHV